MSAGRNVIGICFTACGADSVCKFVSAGCYVIGVECAAGGANTVSKLVDALFAAAGTEKHHRKNQHRNKKNQL